MDHRVTLLMSEFVTHDVRRLIVEKPDGLRYEPGQGVELAIDHPDWKEEGRPFTPTSLRDDWVLEFTIKGYPDHHGVTEQLHKLQPGAQLLMSDAFGTINYQGPGTFIAGGAGVTPFIAILRQLAIQGRIQGHTLMFSNKTPGDIICEKEFRHMLGPRCLLTCTDESAPGYDDRRIDVEYLRDNIDDFGQRFYVCGPPKFVEQINAILQDLGASPDALVFER
jgi:ferredoxin-NADP reductase